MICPFINYINPKHASAEANFIFQYVELAEVAQFPHEDTILTCNSNTFCVYVKKRTILCRLKNAS